VIAQHRVDRHLERAADLGQQGRLLGLAVRGEVAGEQDEIDGSVDLSKGASEVLAVLVVGVDIACGCETYWSGHGRNSTDWRPRLRGKL